MKGGERKVYALSFVVFEREGWIQDPSCQGTDKAAPNCWDERQSCYGGDSHERLTYAVQDLGCLCMNPSTPIWQDGRTDTVSQPMALDTLENTPLLF